jgi:hypothetical protein
MIDLMIDLMIDQLARKNSGWSHWPRRGPFSACRGNAESRCCVVVVRDGPPTYPTTKKVWDRYHQGGVSHSDAHLATTQRFGCFCRPHYDLAVRVCVLFMRQKPGWTEALAVSVVFG